MERYIALSSSSDLMMNISKEYGVGHFLFSLSILAVAIVAIDVENECHSHLSQKA